MNDLPDLPFEKILGHLSLQERIKCRSVSRRWWKTIDSFRPKSLCYSTQPSDFIYRKSRLVSGTFARNFIDSAEFYSFFRTFGKSIFSNLKHLRLCSFSLDAGYCYTAVMQTLNSFGRLEKLDIIWFVFRNSSFTLNMEFELSLPMLNSIQLEGVEGIKSLTLDAPKLQNVKISSCACKLNILHTKSVEKLIIDGDVNCPKMKNLKNLKYLYLDGSAFDPMHLSGLEQLKEIHLYSERGILKLFEQKPQYGRVDLKIFFGGCLLSDPPNDPAIHAFTHDCREHWRYLVQHSSKLADQIPFRFDFEYEDIQSVPRGSETTILNRFTDLYRIIVSSPVQDVERFLDILKNLDNIAELYFDCSQPQDLFDRLPEHCSALQKLVIIQLTDFRFVFRFRNLIELELPNEEIDAKLIRKIWDELKFLSKFTFLCFFKLVTMQVRHHPKRFEVSIKCKAAEMLDLDSAIQFIVEKATKYF